MADRSMADLFPSNSKTTNKPPESKKIITGKVSTSQPSFKKKMAETFVAKDAKNVGQYVLFDVVIPMVKDLVVNSLIGTVEMLFYGETRKNNSGSIFNNYVKPLTDYGKFFYNGTNNSSKLISVNNQRSTTTSNITDLVFENKQDAESVRIGLLKQVEQFDVASVGDLYDMVGKVGNYTDENWGWTKLRPEQIGIRKVANGYILDLPRPEYIK